MNDTDKGIPADWAIDRAIKLTRSPDPMSASMVKEAPQLWPMTIAFARYIAEHEEEPVDPLREEAIALVLGEAIARTAGQIEAIKAGLAGGGKIELALAALRRGMELAKVTPE